MENDLLDISGKDNEDYWLLKTTPKKGVSSFAGGNSCRKKSSLNCSPLQIPRSSRIVPTRPPFSSIRRVSGNIMEQPCPSVDTDNVGKENTSDNKVELPKLSVERQQMKKKKKNAGFNLRKSLAWDRAFSTEEGVLDSSELSKITGGNMLSAIQEEFKESTSNSKCTSFSPGLQALEENLFDDFPVNSKKKEKKILNGVLPKYASPSRAQSSLAQKKVIAAQDLRSGSKRSGCHRPPTSSPANAHTTPRSRELNLSEVSTTKLDTLTVANNMKRITQSPSKVKKNQATQIKNSQRSLGSVSNSQSSGSVSNSQSSRSVSFSHNTSSAKSKTKSNLGSRSSITKSTLKQAKRNVISKTSKIPSVSNSQHSVAGKSNIGSMTTSDVAMPGHASNIPDSNVTTIGTSLAQSSCSRVGSQPAVSRLGKPSGLRVPSPSIGYFSQSDSQPSQSAGDKHRQLPRSDVCSASSSSLIPTFEKPQVAEKVPGVYSKGATGNIGSSGSAVGFFSQSINFKPSEVEVKVDLKSTREVGSKVSCCSLTSQINENLQHPCILQGDSGKIVLDDINICTSEKISTAKCEDLQSNSELPPSECKNSGQDGNISCDDRDDKRKSWCSVEECALSLKDSMDSPMHRPGDELTLCNNHSQLKVSNPGEEVTYTSNGFSGDFDTLDKHGQSLNECVHAENGDGISPCLSGEKKVLTVYHSNENVAKQHDVLDSFTAYPTFLGNLSSMKSDIEDISYPENQLGNTEYFFVHSEIVEEPDGVESPCNHLEENFVSDSILCDHNLVCDGQVVFEKEKRTEISKRTETNCEADFIGPFTNCKNWFRESEEKQLSSQLVLDVKAGCREIDVLTRSISAEKDDGHDVQIDYFTGSSDAEQNMEQVKVLTSSSFEARMEVKPLESSHEPFSEKLTSEKSSIENVSEGNDGCVMKQADQLAKSDECSPAKDASAAVFSYLNEELEDNSELEDMDLVTESDCSDEEPEGNMERTEGVVTESELNSDRDEFSVKGILNQGYSKIESVRTVSNLCGETKTLLSKSISSSTTVLEDPECLNEETSLSRSSEGMSKENTNSGSIAHNNVGKANIQTDTEKDCSAQHTDQELGSHEGDEVQVIKISTDHVAAATREEESRTPIPMNGAFLDGDDMQPNEFTVVSNDILTLERNGAHASDSSSRCTCASEGEEKMIILDAKLEKKPDPIVVKPPNAVPFSDEWLAAIEAAGEEILTLKSGRVQHSPTEKFAPEPGPWSPVKKKSNQVVGPFDCTKYNNKGLSPAFN